MPEFSVRRRTFAGLVVAALAVGATAVLVPLAGPGPAALAASAPGATVRASVDGAGAGSQLGGYQQELAAGGNAVVFTSDSQLDDLPVGDYENVYVRDLNTQRTVMISRGQFHRPEPPEVEPGLHSQAQSGPDFGEVTPDQDSYQPTISADGRFVAFVTTATNIVVADDDHDQDIIVCDRDPDGDGIFDEDKENGERDYRYFRVTEPRLSGGEISHRIDHPRWPKLSDDATRIVWLDRGFAGSHLRDLVRTAVLRPTPATDPGPPATAGFVPTPLGEEVLEGQGRPDVSGDGRFIVLTARYRIETHDPYDDEVRHAAVLRVDAAGALTRVDVGPAGEPIGTEEGIFLSSPVISRDGAVIAFDAELYFYDPCDGDCRRRSGQPNVFAVRLARDGTVTGSELVSRDNAGEPVNGLAPGLSGDGRFVSFVTDNPGAHDGVDNAEGRSCLFRPATPGTPAAGSPAAGSPAVGPTALPPREERREVRTTCQVVLRDLVADQERQAAEEPRLPGSLASPGTGGACAVPMPAGGTCGGNANTTPYRAEQSPTLSSDGGRIAFESDATDLEPDVPDRNDARDVFVRTFHPELRADPAPLDFGEVLVDTPATATVRLDHVGIGPLVVVEVATDDDGFTVLDQTCAEEGILLQQAGNCLVEVEFRPRAEGEFSGLLHVRTTDEREFTVDLTGIGIPEPPDDPGEPQPGPAAFSAGPDPLNFGTRLVHTNGPNATVTVTNTGDTPMTVGGVTVEPPAARRHYTVTGNTCVGAPIAPGASCAVSVRLVPTASGNLPGVLSFADDAPGAPHLVGLVGTAPRQEIEVSPAVTPPGRVVAVTGRGFTPNQQVVLTVPLAVQTAPATVAPDGTFRAALLVLPKAAIGTRTVEARVNAFPAVGARTSLLVVTPTVGPAEFVVRG